MASAFAHGVVAVTVGQAYRLRQQPLRFWVLGVICAIVPDADVITFAFGVSYGDFWGHRGFTHSLTFALLLAVLVTFAYFKDASFLSRAWWGYVSYFFICTALHGVVDAMTNGGLGIAFFSPFENGRYFLPWRPLLVPPIGVGKFFSSWGLEVLVSELIWIGIPCAVLALGFRMYYRAAGGSS